MHFRICCLGPKADAAGHSHVQHNLQVGRTCRTMPGHLTTASMGELQNLQRTRGSGHTKSLVETPGQNI